MQTLTIYEAIVGEGLQALGGDRTAEDVPGEVLELVPMVSGDANPGL